MSMIGIRHVGFTYPTGTEALQDLDLDIRTDEALFVLGHNGAGKSTLLRMLNGLLKPTTGVVTVGETDTRKARPAQLARTVGLVFQNPDSQLFRVRVRDEVAFGAFHGTRGDADAHARIERAMEQMQLQDVADENPYDLPLALRKRVTIASVLAMNTPIVVLDEPTGGQDVAGTRILAELIRTLRAEGRAVVVVTHDVDLAFDLADRVVVMAKGRLHLEGTPGEVLGHPRLPEAGLEASSMHTIWQELELAGAVGDFDRLFDQLATTQDPTR